MRAARPNVTDQHDEVHDIPKPKIFNCMPAASRPDTRSLQLGQNVAKPQHYIGQHRNPEYVHRESGSTEATDDRQYNEYE